MMYGHPFHLSHQADSAMANASEASRVASDARMTAQDLTERIDNLTLVCMAMWTLMREKTGVTEEELMQRVKDLDLMDGVEDGKITKTVAKCGSCNRVMSPRHKKCMYCGAERLVASAFDQV